MIGVNVQRNPEYLRYSHYIHFRCMSHIHLSITRDKLGMSAQHPISQICLHIQKNWEDILSDYLLVSELGPNEREKNIYYFTYFTFSVSQETYLIELLANCMDEY